ncbi:unnamed protein product [Brassica oleracea var. botrytis]
MGFILYELDREVICGQRKGPPTSSPLHAMRRQTHAGR